MRDFNRKVNASVLETGRGNAIFDEHSNHPGIRIYGIEQGVADLRDVLRRQENDNTLSSSDGIDSSYGASAAAIRNQLRAAEGV